MLIGIILRRGLPLVESKKIHPGAGEREAKGLSANSENLESPDMPAVAWAGSLGPCSTAPESIEDTQEASSTVHFPSPT